MTDASSLEPARDRDERGATRRRRGLPGPAVAIGLVVFCAVVLAFVAFRRQAAIEASGPLTAVVPFTMDEAIAVRGTVDDAPGGFLLRIHRSRGMRWTVPLPGIPEDTAGVRTLDGEVRVRVAEDAWRAFALEDGSARGTAPAPDPAPPDDGIPTPELPASLVGQGRRMTDMVVGASGGALALVVSGEEPTAGERETTPAVLVHLRPGDHQPTWAREATGRFALVAVGDDLYAQSGRGLLVRVRGRDGEILAAARAPGGADAGYPLGRHLFIEDRLWLHDDLVMVTLDRRTLRTLVGLDRIRAVPALDTLDEELPPQPL